MSNLGSKIRELRLSRGLTLDQVATDTGLSVSFLSMLERDKASISVDNLERLAQYYQIHMVHFFNAPEETPLSITRRADILKSLGEMSAGPATVTLLANRANARMEPLLIHIAPGKEEPHFRKHEADMLVYILKGKARLIAETGEVSEINEGDLVYYVNYPHRRFANASADEALVMISITAPPTSSLDDLMRARNGAWMMGANQ